MIARPIVTFLSDFGIQDTFVGQMKGVVLSNCRDVSLVDLTHSVPPQSIIIGAIHLAASWKWFPAGTIHVAVVDPGVGTQRRAIGIRYQDHFFIGPDNGLFGGVLGDDAPQEAVALAHSSSRENRVSRTFHGRDVFAVTAGRIAAGDSLSTLGLPFDPANLMKLSIPEPEISASHIAGEILLIDRYGNAVTNIAASALGQRSGTWSVRCGDFSVDRLSSTYADVDIGAPLAAISSMDTVELCVRNGSAESRYDLIQGMPVHVYHVDECE